MLTKFMVVLAVLQFATFSQGVVVRKQTHNVHNRVSLALSQLREQDDVDVESEAQTDVGPVINDLRASDERDGTQDR